MSATAELTLPPTTASAPRMSGLAVTFNRIVKAEWVKLISVRSTLITMAAIAAVMIGIGALAAAVTSGAVTETAPNGGPPGFANASDPTGTSLAGALMAQLIVAVLGVLVITNEFSNGMIRTYFAAIPKRLPVLWAKGLVTFVAIAVITTVSSLIAFFVGQGILGSNIGLGDDGVLRAVVGTGLYLAGIGVLGLAIGTLLRHTAGAIAALFGLLLIVPGLISVLLPTDWADAVAPYLPSNAGSAFTSVNPAENLLSVGGGIAVFVTWIVVLIGLAAWRMKSKDA